MKFNKSVSEALKELIEICYLINTKTEQCAFLDFSGHVEKISVKICLGKEGQDFLERLYEKDCYFSGEDWTLKYGESQEDPIQQLLKEFKGLTKNNFKKLKSLIPDKQAELEAKEKEQLAKLKSKYE